MKNTLIKRVMEFAQEKSKAQATIGLIVKNGGIIVDKLGCKCTGYTHKRYLLNRNPGRIQEGIVSGRKTKNQQILELAAKSDTGICVHDVQDLLGDELKNASSKINQLLRRGELEACLDSQTCLSSSKRHKFFFYKGEKLTEDLDKTKEEEVTPKEEKKQPVPENKDITIAELRGQIKGLEKAIEIFAEKSRGG